MKSPVAVGGHSSFLLINTLLKVRGTLARAGDHLGGCELCSVKTQCCGFIPGKVLWL